MYSMQCSVPLTGQVSTKEYFKFKQTCVQRRNRKNYKCQSGLLDIFGGQGKSRGAATEIVDEILELARPTYGGIFAGQKRKQQIAELVDQLSQYRGRAPTRNPSFFGPVELIYSENPFSFAGPFRKPPVLLILQGQESYQYIDKSTSAVTSYTSFKSLGVFPGFTKLMGMVEFVSGDLYRTNYSHLNISLGIGGISKSPREFSLTFYIVYQDERIRIVTKENKDAFTIFEKIDLQDTSVSLQDLAYEEFQPSGGDEEYYEEQAVYQVEEKEEDEQSKKPSFFNFSLNGRKQGTVAIQNSKQVPGSGTVRLTQTTSMDDVRSNVKMYQQQVKDAKQVKKQLSTSLREQQQQQAELAKQSEKIQQQVNRTEVEVENVRQMLVQINEEEKQSQKQLELLQSKLYELEQSTKA